MQRVNTPNAKVFPQTNSEEAFQNTTVRPIVKTLHEWLIVVFKDYLKKHHVIFNSLTVEKQRSYIINTLQKDASFRSFMIGAVSGHFTKDELSVYLQFERAINKRIVMIIKQRYIDSISTL